MRALAVMALLASMGLAALFVVGPPPAPEGGGTSAAELLAELRAQVDPAAEQRAGRPDARARHGDPSADGPGSPPTFYQYTDDQGRIHYVQSAADVPDRYRQSAGELEVTSEIIRPAQPSAPERPVPQRAGPTKRAFAYDPGSEPARARSAQDVVVYTTPWCGWCRKTLAWLDARGVDYENRDIEADPAARRELIARTGTTSIPVVDVDGELIRGYSPGRMTQLLEL